MQKHKSHSNFTIPRKASHQRISNKSTERWVTDFFKSIGEWRDRVLVITGLFYIAGYLIWSWNALQNNLGLLPAFQFQYIVAGIGPVVIGTAAIGGGLLFWRWLNNVWLINVETGSGYFWKTIRLFFRATTALAFFVLVFDSNPTIVLMFAIAFFVLSFPSLIPKIIPKATKYFAPFKELPSSSKATRVFLMLVVIGILYWLGSRVEVINSMIFEWLNRSIIFEKLTRLSSYTFVFTILFGSSTLIPDWLAKVYRVSSFFIIVIGIALISLLFYQERIYTQLPQEFGGVKSRCAYLDIKTENLSDETREAIFLASQINQSTSIIRSKKLDVLFSSNNMVMVRIAQSDADNIVYEIPRTNIQAIAWCK